MKNKLSRFHAAVKALVGSDRFFYGSLILLVLESAWIALSGLYSMAFDENTHYDVIKLYAHHLSPFWSGQPDGAATYGVVSRDLSYLYQYLISFVYRFLDLFVHGDTPKIIVLRFISIAFMVVGFVLYRRVLLRTKVSKVLVHTVLGILVLIPTVPFLAAQINYDNMLFMMAGVMFLVTMRLVDGIKNGVYRKSLPAGLRDVLVFLSLGMLTCLVKYPFAPVFFVLAVWVLAVYWRTGGGSAALKRLPRSTARAFGQLPTIWRVGLAVLLVVSSGLFFERYGLNTIRYGTPLPECNQVLGVDRCMDYGPWRRNYLTYQDKIQGKLAPVPLNPVYFTVKNWMRLMGYQLFFALNGQAANFSVGAPLPLPFITGMVLGVAGVLAFVWQWRYVLARPYMKGLLALALFYTFSLWVQNYSDYLHLHLAIAIQARYLIMVLPIFGLAGAIALNQALRKLPAAKSVLAAAVLFIMLFQGGGAGVFILRSNPTWYWPNQTVVQANEKARNVLRTFVIGKGWAGLRT